MLVVADQLSVLVNVGHLQPLSIAQSHEKEKNTITCCFEPLTFCRKIPTGLLHSTFSVLPRAGSGVERIDPLRFLAGYR